MNTLDAIRTRRSTRKFKDSSLDESVVNQVIEAGRHAPSGGNSQSTRFIVISNRSILDEFENLVKDAFSKMEVYPGMYKSMVNSIKASKTGKYIYDYKAPVLIITANKKDYGNNIADCACALENMMIVANELDLGSCWINQLKWLNEDSEILDKLYSLGMKEDERVYGALAIGIADTDDAMPVRKPLTRTGNEVIYVK